MILSSSVSLNFLSNGIQVYANFVAKSTGNLAFATFLISWIGSLMRFYTILVEASDDKIYILNGLSSVIMCSLFML